MIDWLTKTDTNYEMVQGNEDIDGVCPFCGSCAEGVAKQDDKYFVVCDNPHCEARGSRCSTIEEAVKFWNGATINE